MPGLNAASNPFAESLWQDLRYAARSLRQSRSFFLIVVLTLALGVGAMTSIYSVVEAVILRPLPYRHPEQLVIFPDGFTRTDIETLKTSVRTLSDIGVYYRTGGRTRVTLTGAGDPVFAQAGFISANTFPLLGLGPALGRWFTVDEEARREHVLLLAYGVWQRQFGSAVDVLDKTLELDGQRFRIIGVMPREFQFPTRDLQLWAPLSTNRTWGEVVPPNPNFGRQAYAQWEMVARLRSGASLPLAESETNQVNEALQRSVPERNRLRHVRAEPLGTNLNASSRRALLILFGAVCIMLLIVCANVGNLMFARGASRERELAVRTALGASRRRLFQQLIVESASLALCSGTIGLVLAWATLPILRAFGPSDLPRLDQAVIDVPVAVFALSVSLLTALIVGAWPAWIATRRHPQEALQSGARGTSGSIHAGRARTILIGIEYALSFVLLVGATLLVRSLIAVLSVDPGFQPEHVVTMSVALPPGTPVARRQSHDELVLQRLRGVAGVAAVGAINGLLTEQPGELELRAIDGHEPESHTRGKPMAWNTVRGEYFQAMGTRLVRGRFFSEQDGSGSPLVAIVDETMAHRYWTNGEAIGKQFKGGDRRGMNDDWLTVIGVVRDMRRHGREQQSAGHVFEWYRQARGNATTDLVIRTAGDPIAVGSTARSIVRTLDMTAVVSPLTTLEQGLSDQVSARRFQTWLLGVLALSTLVLAGLGLYGVVHYSVEQRSHEIGIRIALGASRSRVMGFFVRQALSVAAVGVICGVIIARWMTQALGSLLFGVSPLDTLTFGGVMAGLFSLAAVASAMPAWRAARLDPLKTLRHN